MAFEQGGTAGASVIESLTEEQKRAWHQRVMWGLYGLGVVLVLFANPLGNELAPKTYFGNNSVFWSTEDVRAIATNLRIIGGMAFAAGLVERLVLAITSQKPDGS